MAPPKFSDIGKSARSLFSDDFYAGSNKVTLKSKASNGVNLTVKGQQSSKGVVGSLETKYAAADGITVTEKWNTNTVVDATVECVDQFVKGSKVAVSSSFSPVSGLFNPALKTSYVNDSVATTFDFSGGKAAASGVFGYSNYYFGASGVFDTASSKMAGTKIAGGYFHDNIVVTSSITDGQDVSGTLWHQPRGDLSTGVQFSWNKSKNATQFAIAARHQLDDASFVKAKLNKDLLLGVSYTLKINQGVTLGMGADINGSKLSGDGHKVGLSLTFQN